ncbi:helix-turn-helix domain-containing protein [Ferruginibacter sp. SUN106]|uniref:helix-turn-helix domain-containing protein n=1 Tax=Ferruginibacter sp. SUN106 TaxID=2978348 RepID=UPI003D35FBD0
MKKATQPPQLINSISEWHRIFSFAKPGHPLISLIQHADVKNIAADYSRAFAVNFYIISIKKSFKGKMRYGKNYYDFDEGTMGFISPGQVIAVDDDASRDCLGWSLLFHPDLIRHYPLGKNIKNYGFFSYDVNEALHLSDKEDNMIDSLIKNIALEYHSSIDHYSQDVMVSHLELLLNYANRFYNRQFITRKTASSDLLTQMDDLLTDYFNGGKVEQSGLPTVQFIAAQLHVSPNYLSDMLRTLTGQNTQQHIHNKLIEKAKEILTTTSLSVSEIAYQLGFEYPQSFNKLFKSKTNVTPLKFRNSFN